MQLGESRPVVGARIALPVCRGGGAAADAGGARRRRGRARSSRSICAISSRSTTPSGCCRRPTSRRAWRELAFAAGRIAEKLGDVGGAIERYEAALEAEPKHAHALRGLRRLRLADGKREPVLGMLDRELELASPAEKRGLHAVRAELALALGDRDVARASYEAILKEQADDLGALTGLVDLAASGGDEGRAEALGQLVRSARHRGRADARGAARRARRGSTKRPGACARRWRAIARRSASIPTAMAAAWGLLRVAVRTPGAGRRRRDARAAGRAPARGPAAAGARASPRRRACARRRRRGRASGAAGGGRRRRSRGARRSGASSSAPTGGSRRRRRRWRASSKPSPTPAGAPIA